MNTIIKQKDTVVLSVDDIKVLEAISNGVTVASIPKKEKIHKSVRTIEGRLLQLRNIYGCRSTTHLVAKFLREGIIK